MGIGIQSSLRRKFYKTYRTPNFRDLPIKSSQSSVVATNQQGLRSFNSTKDASISTVNYYGSCSNGNLAFINNASNVTTLSSINFSSTTDGDVLTVEVDNLFVDTLITLSPKYRCKGMAIYVRGDLFVDGSISMSFRGAYADPVAAGVNASGLRIIRNKQGGTDSGITASDVAGCGNPFINSEANQRYTSSNLKIVTVSRAGGSGGAGGTTGGGGPSYYSSGIGGTATNGTGGGAGGAFIRGFFGNTPNDAGASGSGKAGTCFSGGNGGGDAHVSNYGPRYGTDATANGGPGGNDGGGDGGYGGVGNPNGANSNPAGYSAYFGAGTAGLLYIFVAGRIFLNGTISSNGTQRAATNGNTGGGMGGGGRVIVLYGKELINNGSITANGASNGGSPGGICSGGAGEVTTDQIDI